MSGSGPVGIARAVLRDAVVGIGWGLGLTRPARAVRDRLNVVTFHRVLPRELARDYPIDTLAVTTEEFEWFLRLFAEHFTCATLRDAHLRWSSGERPPRPWLAITFDDGQRDNHTFATPLLERSGLAATFFVPTDAVESGEPLWHDRLAWAVTAAAGRRARATQDLANEVGAPRAAAPRELARHALNHAKRLADGERVRFVHEWERRLGGAASPAWDGMMTWAQVRELADGGHEIGSHGCSHAILTRCDDARLSAEVGRSREILQDRCGAAVESFCYPDGGHDARSVAAVARAGYARAVTTRWGPNALAESPLTLRRCDIQGRTARSARGRLSAPRVAWRLAGWAAARR